MSTVLNGSESTATTIGPCRVCGVTCATRCSLCHRVHYCSPKHIKSDWPSHKVDCFVRPPKNAGSGGVGAHEISGILFHEDEDVPRMIKVKCLVGYTEDGKWWQTRNLRPYLPDDESKGLGNVRMDGPLVPGEGGELFDTAIEIFFRSGFPKDGSKKNRCIQRLTRGRMAQPWAGPFIAFRRTALDTLDDGMLDQDMSVLIRYFTYGITKN